MHPRSAAPYYVVLAGTLIACALMGLCVLQLFQSRHDALDRARETSRNLALVAERDIERNIELYGLSLEAVIQPPAAGRHGGHAALRAPSCSIMR